MNRLDNKTVILVSVLALCATAVMCAWIFRPPRWEYRHISGRQAYRFDSRTGEAELVNLRYKAELNELERQKFDEAKKASRPISKHELSFEELTVRDEGQHQSFTLDELYPEQAQQRTPTIGVAEVVTGLIEAFILALLIAWIGSLFGKEKLPISFWRGNCLNWLKYHWMAVSVAVALVLAMHFVVYELQRDAMALSSQAAK